MNVYVGNFKACNDRVKVGGQNLVRLTYCLYPGCNHLNDDEGRTDLCGCHLQKLIKVIKRKKKEHPNFYRGVGVHKILERLTRTEILKLLNVDEETIRKVVSKANPPTTLL